MKKMRMSTLVVLMLITIGCGKSENGKTESPAFMFWCYRQEVVSSDYLIPEMTTPGRAAYIQNRLKGLPGFVRSQCDLENRTLTISYQSSTIRKMNVEESIAMLGFSVNGRPADPTAKIPNGVK